MADNSIPKCPSCKGTSFYGQHVGLPTRSQSGKNLGEHDVVLIACSNCGTVVSTEHQQQSWGRTAE